MDGGSGTLFIQLKIAEENASAVCWHSGTPLGQIAVIVVSGFDSRHPFSAGGFGDPPLSKSRRTDIGT
jgi:hypothetical protein